MASKKKFDFVDVEDNKPIETKPTEPIKKNFYALVLDASGSMKSVREATMEGVNKQIETIKSLADQYKDQACYMTLVIFSDASNVNTIYLNRPIDKGSKLTKEECEDAFANFIRVLEEDRSIDLAKGDLNYVICSIIWRYLKKIGIRYHNLNDFISGVLDEALSELKNRIVNKYEEGARGRNGDFMI